MDGSGARDRLWQQLLGLPPELVSTSLLSMTGLREIADLLDLQPGRTLLDLACGRGGYGLWLARETGCSLVGVDFSSVAVEDASRRVPEFGLEDRAGFRVGELQATGLAAASVDAVLCVDAIQFATDTAATAAEIRRVLRPGGIAVLTSWEGRDRTDEVLPARLRDLDLAAALPAGGLVGVRVLDRDQWLDIERELWTAVMAVGPDGDAGIVEMQEEGEISLSTVLPRVRRVLAVGRAPA
jgi:SAM-dependent methyltransferase